jgi:hypothetical protein
MEDQNITVRAHYYCGLMGEAIVTIVRADRLRSASEEMTQEGDNSLYPDEMLSDAGVFARYAFLLACNAFENCAFSLLESCDQLDTSLLDELERLRTLTKFELFALANGTTLPRGDERFGKAKQVVRCRNDFVHPKGLQITIAEDGKAVGREAGPREYPLAFDFIEIDHVIEMIGDILRFVAWVVCDLSDHELSEGAKLINGEMKWWTADFHTAKSQWNYDLRSLGDFSTITVTEA